MSSRPRSSTPRESVSPARDIILQGSLRPGTPAATVSPFLTGVPFVGAVVVGGSAASNPAAQIALAGSNNGSNLDLHRNLFTYEDQAACTNGTAPIQIRRVVPAIPVQRKHCAQPIRTGHVSELAAHSWEEAFGTGSFLIDPSSTPLSWRSLFGAFYVEDVIRVSTVLHALAGLPR